METPFEKDYKKVTKGDESKFFVADSGEFFGIGFDKIFKQDMFGIYSAFSLSSKRNFKNLAPSILQTYQELFLKNGEFDAKYATIFFDILNIKSKLMVNESGTTLEMFLGMLDKLTDSNNKLLLTSIEAYVNENYALELDKATQAAKDADKRVNTELQFSDKHAKNLLKIAVLFRVTIPLISEYFTWNKSLFAKSEEDLLDDDLEDLKFEDINSLIFQYLFAKFFEREKARALAKATTPEEKELVRGGDFSNPLKNKLYKLTYSRVSRTSYSDKRFWTAAKLHGITKDTVSLEIYKKLIVNAIPKLSLDADRNIVSFLSSVVNNQVGFLFQNKFKHRLSSLGATAEKYGEDEDDSSEYERLEIQMLRKDEGLYIVRKLNIEQVLKGIPEKLGIEVSESEVKDEVVLANRHTIQEQIVSFLTFKYFKDKQAIKFLTFYQYTFLVIMVRKYLEKHKFTLLPQILSAHCEKHKERVGISGKKIRPSIQGSKKYKELFAAKFRNFANDIEKPLSSIIATTYSSIFTDREGKELFDSTTKVDRVADELIDLAFLI